MHGGTYSEALKAGFNEEQAGFLSRLSSETYSEAIQTYKEEQAQKARERANYMAGRNIVACMIVAAFVFGIFVGKALAA